MYSPTDTVDPAAAAAELELPAGRWWGRHLAETRWQLELARLLVDPVLRGQGVLRGDGRPVVLMPGFLAGDQTLLVLARWLRLIGYQPYTCRFIANVQCADRAVERVERQIDRLHGRSGRRVAVIGHSRGGHYARALGHRRPELVSHAISLGAGLRAMLAISYPTQGAVAVAREALRRTGTARSPGLLHRSLRLRLRARLHRPIPEGPGPSDQHLLQRRWRRSMASRARAVRRMRRGQRQPRRAGLQPQDLPRDRRRTRRAGAGARPVTSPTRQ
jgi:triacylglycerol lipase